MGPRFADVCSVLKLRIGVAIAASAVAGAAVASATPIAPWKIGVLALAVLMASGSAGAFNHFFERDLVARMKRTRSRPFVRGTMQADAKALVAIGLLLVIAIATASFALGPLVGLYIFLGAFVYSIVYTVWLKRRTSLNIIVGGLSGSFAVLAGAAAVDPAPTPISLLLAIALFLWTPPHFWSLAAALHDDYAAAGVPMLPVTAGIRTTSIIILAHVAALVLISMALAGMGMGGIYLAAAAAGGGYFVWRSIKLVIERSPRSAMANFHASLVQLMLLLGGAVADRWI